MNMKSAEELVTELTAAKQNVRWLLDHADGFVDMHGLEHWAGEVGRLRRELKGVL